MIEASTAKFLGEAIYETPMTVTARRRLVGKICLYVDIGIDAENALVEASGVAEQLTAA